MTKNTLKTAKRLLGYVTSTYKVQFVLVLICILISSIASISVSLSLKFLLDDYIIPLIGNQNPDFTELYTALAYWHDFCLWRTGFLPVYKADGCHRAGRAETSERRDV